jgi:nicotinamide riboside kinase
MSLRMSKLRIAFTGPESSGKTTLALWLSKEMGATYCVEYAREFLENKKSYSKEDLSIICKGQINTWKKVSPLKGLIADTELLVIQIWSLWKYKSCEPEISEAVKNQQFDHYFLCKPDIPWEPDELRESEHERDILFNIYEQNMKQLGWNYTILFGDIENRKSIIRTTMHNLDAFANL